MNRSPGHLAKLCCNRCLSSDHILKFVGMLSSPNCQAVYINYVQNLQNLIDRLKTFDPLPIKLIFFVNVKTRGKGVTLLGSDNNPGNHWTMDVYDSLANEVIYGDSLSQDMPNELLKMLSSLWLVLLPRIGIYFYRLQKM